MARARITLDINFSDTFVPYVGEEVYSQMCKSIKRFVPPSIPVSDGGKDSTSTWAIVSDNKTWGLLRTETLYTEHSYIRIRISRPELQIIWRKSVDVHMNEGG